MENKDAEDMEAMVRVVADKAFWKEKEGKVLFTMDLESSNPLKLLMVVCFARRREQ